MGREGEIGGLVKGWKERMGDGLMGKERVWEAISTREGEADDGERGVHCMCRGEGKVWVNDEGKWVIGRLGLRWWGNKEGC